MLWVRKLMGWVLVVMAVYFLKPILHEPAATMALSAVLLAAGAHLAWIDQNQATFKMFPWLKAVAGAASFAVAAFLIASLLMRGPGITWAPFSDDALKDAAKQKRPVIIDFYAAWCAACRELDEITFHDAAVVKQAQFGFVMIKVDVTKGDNPVYERLLQQYEIKGVPTIVFLDAGGKERLDLRLVDYLPPDQFISRMAELKKAES